MRYLQSEVAMNPLFCPNNRCPRHDPKELDPHSSWYVHFGFYFTKVVGPVRRYRCVQCGKTFSDRTFDIDYYTKKTIPYQEIFHRLSTSESVSGIARNLHFSSGSIQNRIDRLSRETIALHERLERGFFLRESLVADGFESFDRSQFFPNNINILVGKESQYLYGFTHVTIRRKGRMTQRQKAKRENLEKKYRAPRGGIESSFAELLKIIPLLWNKLSLPSLSLVTDEHPSYPRAVSHVPDLVLASHERAFSHVRISSTLARTISNQLFAVNYYDREFRKDQSAHHRESTCFCRNVANGCARLAVYQAWHNFVKPFRVKCQGPPLPPHAVFGGIEASRIAIEFPRLFRQRSFLSHLNLRSDRLKVWMKRLKTPLKEKWDYLPIYATG